MIFKLWYCLLSLWIANIFGGVTLTESQRMMKNTNTCKVKGWCQEYFPFILQLNWQGRGRKSWDRKEEKYVATWKWRHYYIVYWHLPVCGVTDGFRMSAGHILTCRRKRGERWKGCLYQVYGILQGRELWGFMLLFLCRKLRDKKKKLCGLWEIKPFPIGILYLSKNSLL